jgi:hypothetical protein
MHLLEYQKDVHQLVCDTNIMHFQGRGFVLDIFLKCVQEEPDWVLVLDLDHSPILELCEEIL